MVELTIDGQRVRAKEGDTILQAARDNGIYIPTMCYLSKVTPIESCRICVVEVAGNDGFVLSCATPVVAGIEVSTHSDELFTHRQNIMKMYNVNHPLECGVCDKSGECDLQNKTLEFEITKQEFSAKDMHRPVQDWGFIQYDPSLCIVCEKCVSTCNEIVGDSNLKVKVGGYKSQIEFVGDDCSSCGECMAVCPVGALTSKNFKYNTNAWELQKTPAICSHCSSGCELYYETKHEGSLSNNAQKIYRVSNDYEHKSLCGVGRFGYDIYEDTDKDPAQFDAVVAKFDEYKAIRFNSIITNEEAHILQRLKEELGFKLFNEEARLYQNFLKAFAKTSGKSLYSATTQSVKKSDFITLFGTKVADDNPIVKYAINAASKANKADVIYLHPIEDSGIKNIITQSVRYEVGTEEGVAALLADSFLQGVTLPKEVQNYLDELDIGNLSAESNIGEEELESIVKKLQRKKHKSLIVGSDLYAHKEAENIAKILGLIQNFAGIDVMIIPTATNTLGVSKICELDLDNDRKCIGYNVVGTVQIGVDAEFKTPSMMQQEGTFTTLDKMVVPTNAALEFNGYELSDFANALGVSMEYTIDNTKLLPKSSGYKEIEFDALLNGYCLECVDLETSFALEDVEELPEYNGAVIYNCNPADQVNSLSAKSKNLQSQNCLRGSQQFAVAAKVQDGDRVSFEVGGKKFSKVFKIDTNLKGVIGINPTFGDGLSGDMLSSIYRFNKVNINVERASDE